MVVREEFYVDSMDRVHMIHGYRWYDPEQEWIGVLQIVHGMLEYIERYDEFAEKMAEAGYYVIGHDHLGHGDSVDSMEELGHLGEDGAVLWLKDMELVRRMAVAAAPNLPYIMLGHSMGSFISRLAAEKYIKPDKFIIMGTGGPNPAAGIGLIAIDVVKFFKGERYISKAIDNLAFGTYNSHFKDENDPIAWLTKDKEQKKKYAADPYCTFKFTVSAMHDLVTLNKKANRAAWFQNIKMPVLLVSGADDPVGNYGKGVTKVYEKLKKAGCNVQIKLYENCRHEILNDTCRDEVVRDIENFIE